MAPEVISHTRYTESADVYSFGIVLWECAARQVCDRGMTTADYALVCLSEEMHRI